MTKEKLQSLLDNGAITQEEFDEMSKNIAEPDNTPDPEPAKDPEPKNDTIDYDKLDRIVQARVDKALAAERKEKADLKRQLDQERRANKTDAELKQIEIDEREKTIAEREKALLDKENRLYAIKAIKEAGLDDSGDTSLALVDFVMGEDEATIDERVKAFKELFDKKVAAEVDKRFKASGRTPKQSSNLNGGKNPYKKETFSLTEQMNLEISNPELAKKLKAEAGEN